MKGLTLSLLHLPFAFAFCILHFEFKCPAKIWNFSDSYKIWGLGENWVRAKILGLGEKFRLGQNFWVRANILGSGKIFRFER